MKMAARTFWILQIAGWTAFVVSQGGRVAGREPRPAAHLLRLWKKGPITKQQNQSRRVAA